VAICEALFAKTFAYLGTRKQFGVPLASFQALQHRAADMLAAAEGARVLTDRAIAAVDEGAGTALASAAKAMADDAGRRIGHEAVQMHGGIGVSDELDISHYMRRLACIRASHGGAAQNRGRFAATGGAEAVAEDHGDLGAFREAVRALVGDLGDRLVGVVHAAGVLADGLLGTRGEDELRAALEAKALGAGHLDRATAGSRVSLVVLSSLGAWLGPAGQSAYAAANTLAEAVVRELAEETGLDGLCGPFLGWAELIGDHGHVVVMDFEVVVVAGGLGQQRGEFPRRAACRELLVIGLGEAAERREEGRHQ
jgi:hypothetical protein